MDTQEIDRLYQFRVLGPVSEIEQKHFQRCGFFIFALIKFNERLAEGMAMILSLPNAQWL